MDPVFLGFEFGGTNTRRLCGQLQGDSLVAVKDGGRDVEDQVPTHEFRSPHELVRDFLDKHGAVLSGRPLAALGFAYAAFMQGNRGHGLNMPWAIDGGELGRTLGIRVVAGLNDIAGLTWGINRSPDDVVLISDPSTAQHASSLRTLLAAGTGTGGCVVEEQGGLIIPLRATEFGHSDFAPDSSTVTFSAGRDQFHRELNYLEYLCSRCMRPPEVTRATTETALNLMNCYGFILDVIRAGPEHEQMRPVRYTKDAPAKVCELALARQCLVCQMALELFWRMYGRIARNAVLVHGAFGGCYIGGGPAMKMGATYMRTGPFMTTFLQDVGHHQGRLANMPVWLLTRESGAWGAAFAGFNRWLQLGGS